LVYRILLLLHYCVVYLYFPFFEPVLSCHQRDNHTLATAASSTPQPGLLLVRCAAHRARCLCLRRNTLHVDDLARNFALNPKNGVRCSAYYRNDENNGDTSAAAATAGGELEGVRAVGGVVDQELPLLALYLCHVATHARNDDDDEPPTSSSSSSSPPAPSPSSLSSPPSAASHSAIDLQKWNHLNWREVSLGLMANAAAAASASLASLPLPPSPSGSSNSKTGGGDVGGE